MSKLNYCSRYPVQVGSSTFRLNDDQLAKPLLCCLGSGPAS